MYNYGGPAPKISFSMCEVKMSMQLEQELRDSAAALEQIQAHVSAAEGLLYRDGPPWHAMPATAGMSGREVAWQVETLVRCLQGNIADLQGERDHLIDTLFQAQVSMLLLSQLSAGTKLVAHAVRL